MKDGHILALCSIHVSVTFSLACFHWCRYLQEIDPLTYTDNPWYKESLDAYPDCIMGEAGNYSCSNSEPFLDLLDSPNEGPVTSLIIDAVYALAHGLNDMIGNCTGKKKDKRFTDGFFFILNFFLIL